MGNQLGKVLGVGMVLVAGLGWPLQLVAQEKPHGPGPGPGPGPGVGPGSKPMGQHPLPPGAPPPEEPVKKPQPPAQAGFPPPPVLPDGRPPEPPPEPVSQISTSAPPSSPYLLIPERNPFRLVPEPLPEPPPDENAIPAPPPPPPIQVKLSGVTDMLGGRKMAILVMTEQPQAGKPLPGPPDTKFLYENESYKGVKVLSIDLKKHAVLVDNHGQVTNVVFGKMESSAVAAAPPPGMQPPGVRPGGPGAVVRPPGQPAPTAQPNNASVDQGGGSVIVGGNDYDSGSRNSRGGVFVSGASGTSSSTLGGGSTGSSVGVNSSVGSNPSIPNRTTRTTNPNKTPLFTPPEPPALPPWPVQ